MRKVLIALLVMLIAGNAFAIKRRSLVNHRPFIGWYVAPGVKFGKVADEAKVFAGVRGGMTVNRSVYVGAAIYGLPHDDDDDCCWHHDRNDWLELGYGGIEVGVLSPINRVTTLSVGMLIGGGAVTDRRYADFRDYGFFVVEPSVELAFRLTQSLQLGVGAGYRFVDDLHYYRLSNDDLRGPTFNLNLSFGRF
jgi:hypothetical protein